MREKDLQKTKKRLTIIFTLVVFIIAVFLELTFFSTKYFNTIKKEKNEIQGASILMKSNFITLEGFVSDFIFLKKLPKIGGRKNMKLNEENKNSMFLNLIIFNKKTEEIVFNNIKDNISNELVIKSIINLDYNTILQNENFLVHKTILGNKWTNYDLIIFKKSHYSFNSYITDCIYFIFLTLLFSLIFYYVGYIFVGKNLEPVEKSLNDMQDFIHNAGHELKTPISIIHGNLQLIKETKKYDKKLTNEGINEISRLNKLIDSLIELSNIDRLIENEKIDLKKEIKNVIKENKKLIKEKNIDLNLDFHDELKLNINREYFYILFSNLFYNAIKYNNFGGKIDIILTKNNLIIEDNGIGIENKNLEKIFDRFYQVDKSRNSVGFGIGLALVKKISEIHNWKIDINSEKGKGTRFRINF